MTYDISLSTFWYQLTQVHLENGHSNGER